MTTDLRTFLASLLSVPGLAGWSVRQSGCPPVHQANAHWLSPAQLDEVMSRLALALEGFGHHQLEPLRIGWVFEHLRLHLVRRQDGACLVLFVENRADLCAATVETALADFVKLPGCS